MKKRGCAVPEHQKPEFMLIGLTKVGILLMLSVGTSNGRKGLGLGLGFGGGEQMEGTTELEEGEACSYPDEEDDPSIDPDIALSYIVSIFQRILYFICWCLTLGNILMSACFHFSVKIKGEKLQDVLGHFQKDFEGGVSAENLGAKFGGYGSFLPTYQRSPVWTHPRTPPKVQNHNAARSPNNQQLEGGHHNSAAVPSGVPQSLPPYPPPKSAGLKAPPSSHFVKRDACLSSTHSSQDSNLKCLPSKKISHPPDQKSLKVRIKVGVDNLSTQKNAAIYSGLGLDVSPSSSLDDSPVESEGLSHERQDIHASDESPTSILQIMTSFPVHGSLLLSPLPDDLMHLTENKKLFKDGLLWPVAKGGIDHSVSLVDGSYSIRTDEKGLGQKKKKLVEENDFVLDVKKGGGKDAWSGIDVRSKKELDIDSLVCEEIVSNALRLPLLSNSQDGAADSTKVPVRAPIPSQKATNGAGIDKFFHDTVEEELLGSMSPEDSISPQRQNGHMSLAGKFQESKEKNSQNEFSINLTKRGSQKRERSQDSLKAGSNVSRASKNQNTEPVDSQKLVGSCKWTPSEQDGTDLPPMKESQSSEGKKKSKGSQIHGNLTSEAIKEVSKGSSSSFPRNKKGGHGENNISKNDVDDFKMQNDVIKAKDRYRDFFGDIELEEEEKEIDPLELPSEDKLKESDLVERNINSISIGSKERSSSKKTERPINAETYQKAVSNVAPKMEHGPATDAAPPVMPVVIEENWVCCDKCQKWRLLPIGTNPESLPEKWLCSMLTWLPGMNRCSISEEETTKALIAYYQVPVAVPEKQTNMQSQLNGNASGLTMTNIRHLDQTHQHSSINMPSSGKKKHGSKELSYSSSQDDPTELSNYKKKTVHSSMKRRSLNDINQSPQVNSLDTKQSTPSNGLVVEKRHKQKEKQKLLDGYSDGGDTRDSKSKSKRITDHDSTRAAKKVKTDNMRSLDEDSASDHGLPSAGKDWSKNGGSSKSDTRDSFQVSVKNSNDHLLGPLDVGHMEMGKCESGDTALKKRKFSQFEGNQIYPVPDPSMGHLQESRVLLNEESSENDLTKDKKVRVSKYEGKQSSASKVNVRVDKKGRSTKDQQLGQDGGSTLSQRSLDGIDSLKRDLGSGHPSAAATSSSSKVSSTHKTKGNFQEVKGSPVESVSSSPLRISNPDKVTLARGNVVEKDDSGDVGYFAMVSPRRCSDGEDNIGSDRSGTVRKDETCAVTHRGSLKSSLVDFQGRDSGHLSEGKVKARIENSPEFMNRRSMTGEDGQGIRCATEPQASERSHNTGRESDSHYHANRSHSRKSGKGSSSRSKDKIWSSKSEFDRGKTKNSDFHSENQDHVNSHEEKPRDEKIKFQEKFVTTSNKIENNYTGKRDPNGKLSSESHKRESNSKAGGHDFSNAKVDSLNRQEVRSSQRQNVLHSGDIERSSKKSSSDKMDRMESITGKGKSQPLPPSSAGQNEIPTHPRLVPSSHKGNSSDMPSDTFEGGEGGLKVPKEINKADSLNGNQHSSSRHPTPNGRVRDPDAPSPLRRDSSSQAANNAVKEAKDLKHLADRLKNSNQESTGIYFQAALKFLHGASLLESSHSESAKHSEMIQSMQIYSSTAKLCEFCAREYEKSKDMAAAALAYKCMEIAYMRVIYSSRASAIRDRQKVQMALQIVPTGESPSSSASDVDNLNMPVAADKVTASKGINTPHVTGNHIISARNRSCFMRLCNFAQDVEYALEAAKKSRIAFAAANVRKEEAQHRDSFSSIRRALDFNFQDVEGLLRLVRLAMEAINR
ncbi:Zinc finger, CW-type [Dillenia turbinata]|uniref:Zinc finger, CW-type n=1 Tax=Dillenia turbinata TaxID=194707 RepID=A0AAN8W1M0_9MAGN